VLEEGMVLAMEPQLDHFHLQDIILVTCGEPELLSARMKTDEIFVIS
jgi:hypothetical protein